MYIYIISPYSFITHFVTISNMKRLSLFWRYFGQAVSFQEKGLRQQKFSCIKTCISYQDL